jgi:hypothetical protein
MRGLANWRRKRRHSDGTFAGSALEPSAETDGRLPQRSGVHSSRCSMGSVVVVAELRT